MLKKFTICLVAFISLSLASSTFARSHVSFGINIGVAPPPVYVAPAPVYVAPAPVYVVPAPGYGYYAQAPVVVALPVSYYPAYRYPNYGPSFRFGYSRGHGHGHHR